MNLLQYSFSQFNLSAFKFYSERAGNDRTRAMIRSFWPDNESILKNLLEKAFLITNSLSMSLNISVSMSISHISMKIEGNAVVFMTDPRPL